MSDNAAQGGFIRVACTACNNDDVWFKCNGCGKSDHFTLQTDSVACTCGESYGTGVCTCGETVPFENLHAVAHDEGPLALADLEVAWGRVAGLVVVAGAVVAGIAFLIWGG